MQSASDSVSKYTPKKAKFPAQEYLICDSQCKVIMQDEDEEVFLQYYFGMKQENQWTEEQETYYFDLLGHADYM